jgi:hypothetical protein
VVTGISGKKAFGMLSIIKAAGAVNRVVDLRI